MGERAVAYCIYDLKTCHGILWIYYGFFVEKLSRGRKFPKESTAPIKKSGTPCIRVRK